MKVYVNVYVADGGGERRRRTTAAVDEGDGGERRTATADDDDGGSATNDDGGRCETHKRFELSRKIAKKATQLCVNLARAKEVCRAVLCPQYGMLNFIVHQKQSGHT